MHDKRFAELAGGAEDDEAGAHRAGDLGEARGVAAADGLLLPLELEHASHVGAGHDVDGPVVGELGGDDAGQRVERAGVDAVLAGEVHDEQLDGADAIFSGRRGLSQLRSESESEEEHRRRPYSGPGAVASPPRPPATSRMAKFDVHESFWLCCARPHARHTGVNGTTRTT